MTAAAEGHGTSSCAGLSHIISGVDDARAQKALGREEAQRPWARAALGAHGTGIGSIGQARIEKPHGRGGGIDPRAQDQAAPPRGPVDEHDDLLDAQMVVPAHLLHLGHPAQGTPALRYAVRELTVASTIWATLAREIHLVVG
jgi:hypothetical protein